MSPRLCWDRWHVDQIELSIAARQFHALAIMSLGLFEVGEWPGNRNNGLRTFGVGSCSDSGVPLPVNPTAKMKHRIGPDYPSRFEFRFRHCLKPPKAGPVAAPDVRTTRACCRVAPAAVAPYCSRI